MEIVVKNLKKRYRNVRALVDVSFTMKEGIYGLLGPNGAGKSTLINIMVKTLSQDSGKVLLNGTEIRSMKESYYKELGVLPQTPSFYKGFKVIKLLHYMCHLKGIKKEEIQEEIENAIHVTGLSDDKNKKVKELSGGMRQRLGVAIAILGDPSILIFDEPTAGLDPIERLRFRKMISSLAKGKIVIIATHIVTDIDNIVDEILLLNNGELLIKGSKVEIMSNMMSSMSDEETVLEELTFEDALLYYYR